MSFPAVLTLIFVVAKILGLITWSWLWVLCPMWIGLAIALVILGVGFIAAFISYLLTLRCFRKLGKD